MARQKPILSDTFPADSQVAANVVVVASGTNSGNAALPSGAGATGILGVTKEQADSYNSQFYVGVDLQGIVQCKTLTGTAIAAGDLLKVADANGRVTKLTPAAAGAGTLKGVVGRALSAIGSGAASDTLIDVLLTPGVQMYE
jgi:hypothetical protein